jgi:putative salt-induced outer membrane protein
MRKVSIPAALALLAVAASAHAEWKGKGEAGMVFARGNTDTNSISLKLGMVEEDPQWKNALDMAMLYASTSGDSTANRYDAAWQTNYKFSERSFAFGGLTFDRDQFSGFAYQASATVGGGYKMIDSDKVKLSLQAGIGYRRLKNSDAAEDPGVTSGDAIFTAGMDYSNQLTATTKVVDKFGLETGSDDTLLHNFIGLEVKMSTKMALSVGVDARYNTSPPAQVPPAVPLKKLDTLTTVNLVYAF